MIATVIRSLPALALVALAGSTVPLHGTSKPAPAPERPEWLRPAALRAGDTIAFVAPAGPADPEKVAKAKERFEKMGFQVKVPATLTARKDRYLAGSDEDRAAEFNAAIKDKTVQAVFAVKGGYGLTRILDRIDYAAVRENPKIIAGFSDLTALHLAVAKKCRLVTFHAPMPQYGLYRDDDGFGYSSEVFWRTVRADKYPKGGGGYTVAAPAAGPKPQRLVTGKAKGRLVGGNMTLVGATMGTPYEIEADGNILFLEDTGEKAYRIDRVFSQLRLAGLLDKFAGFVLGTFDGADEKELDTVVREYLGHRKVPVITNYPVGHTPFNATLPHGEVVEIDAEALTLRVLEAPLLWARAPEPRRVQNESTGSDPPASAWPAPGQAAAAPEAVREGAGGKSVVRVRTAPGTRFEVPHGHAGDTCFWPNGCDSGGERAGGGECARPHRARGRSGRGEVNPWAASFRLRRGLEPLGGHLLDRAVLQQHVAAGRGRVLLVCNHTFWGRLGLALAGHLPAPDDHHIARLDGLVAVWGDPLEPRQVGRFGRGAVFRIRHPEQIGNVLQGRRLGGHGLAPGPPRVRPTAEDERPGE